MPAGEKLLREFDEEFANSRRFLSAVPDEHLLWKPHEKSMELGRLAWHLSDFPDWTAMTFTRDVLQWADKDAEEAAHGWKGKTRAQMLARFDADLPRARAALAAATDDQMTRRWKMEWAGQTMIDDPREDVYRKWAMNHMVHHRAQLGVYFRLLGVAVPGCYGPSADEMTAEPAVAG
jgi:uncharacterized damage-inducible protein DinB